MKSKLQATFFGGIRILWKGKLINQFATKKILGLFCYLIENSNVESSRDKLMLLFWGGFPDSQAKYNLRYALWNIRKLFKESESDIDPLITTRTSCRWNPDFPFLTDTKIFLNSIKKENSPNRMAEFERSIQLYKGHFLEGFTLRNLPEWEDWLAQRRDMLHQNFLNIAIELGNHYLRENAASHALHLFNRALAMTPDFEPAHEGIIRAFGNQGKISSALRHYNKYVEIMRRDHSAPPHPDIKALAEHFRKGDYNQEVSAPPEKIEITIRDSDTILSPKLEPEILEEDAGAGVEISPAHEISVLSTTQFVGRDKELEEFDFILDEVKSGKGQVLIISGEMGIGKTRLFNEFISKVPKEFYIGLGEAEEIQSIRPLEELMRVMEEFNKDNRIPPKLRQRLHEILTRNDRTDSEKIEEQLPNIIREWIIDLAKYAPVLIVIDDMHWVSESTLKIFSALSSDAKRLPILLVGIFRTYELQSEDKIAASLISVARTGRLWRMELSKLTEDETHKLISARSNKIAESLKAEDIPKLYNYCAGIPLYALELAQLIEEGRTDFLISPLIDDKPDFESKDAKIMVPPLMQKITEHRISKLRDPLIEILKNTSLLRGQFSLELIKAITEQDSEELEENLVELEQRNFIHHIEENDRITFAFNHQMVKNSINQSINSFEKRRFYKKISKAIEDVDEDTNSDVRAYYLYHSGNQAEAIPYLLQSAETWLKVGDASSGLQYSRIALSICQDKLGDNSDEVLKISRIHIKNLTDHGFIHEAVDVYHSIIDSMGSTLSKKEIETLKKERDNVKQLLKIEKQEKPKELPPLVMVTTKRALANTKISQNELDAARSLLEDADSILDSLPNTAATIRENAMVIQVRAKIAMAEGKYVETIRLLSNTMELMLLHGTVSQLAETWRLYGDAYLKLRKFNYAGEALKQCRTLAEQEDNKPELVYCYQSCGNLAFESGDYHEAERYFKLGIEFCSDLPEMKSALNSLRIELARTYLKMKRNQEAKDIVKLIESSQDPEKDTDILQKINEIKTRL